MGLEIGHRERTVTLRDGRLLGWAEWGDPSGPAVLYFHGTPSSRLDPVCFPDAPAAAGVRLLSIDRPGVGRSALEVTAGVSVWQGDVDKLGPTEHGEDVVARAPGATMVRCPGEGHPAMITHAEELLASAAGIRSVPAAG